MSDTYTYHVDMLEASLNNGNQSLTADDDNNGVPNQLTINAVVHQPQDAACIAWADCCEAFRNATPPSNPDDGDQSDDEDDPRGDNPGGSDDDGNSDGNPGYGNYNANAGAGSGSGDAPLHLVEGAAAEDEDEPDRFYLIKDLALPPEFRENDFTCTHEC